MNGSQDNLPDEWDVKGDDPRDEDFHVPMEEGDGSDEEDNVVEVEATPVQWWAGYLIAHLATPIGKYTEMLWPLRVLWLVAAGYFGYHHQWWYLGAVAASSPWITRAVFLFLLRRASWFTGGKAPARPASGDEDLRRIQGRWNRDQKRPDPLQRYNHRN